MLKVLKFGGSSLADAHQFAKVKSIVDADPARRVVIVSAPGKRFSGDHKITDLLYLCAAHIKYGVSCEDIFAMIRDRYNEIIAECGLKLSLDKEFDELWEKMKNGISQDELASRGEYFSARLMAEYLGYEFIDAARWIKFMLSWRRPRSSQKNPAMASGSNWCSSRPKLMSKVTDLLSDVYACPFPSKAHNS